MARGLVVNKSLLCQTNPPFPTDPALIAKIEEAGTTLAAASERDRSAYRTQTPPCNGCHRTFDAYGLALDSYDSIGRYRTMDPQGRPIDPSVTLPALFDNQLAPDAVAMQNAIAQHPGFTACFGKNMLNWALAEGSQLTPTSCATQAIVSGFNASDKSFASLLREVAVSQAFRTAQRRRDPVRSYRFARRSFLAGIGGAFALEILLRNMEAAAEGASSPARMLLAHFPVGTYKQSYLPKGSQTDFTLSPILLPLRKPQERHDRALRLSGSLDLPGWRGHEAGTPFTTTCANSPGTRANGGEGDDGVAGGPSFDQIFLKHVPGLKRSGAGYINTPADARVDSLETSTQCLSYGEGIPGGADYRTRSIKAANPGGNIRRVHARCARAQPANAYAKLFANSIQVAPSTGSNEAAIGRPRAKGVLDHRASRTCTR